MSNDFIFVKVFPDSKKESISENKKRIEIKVKEPKKDNLANQRASVLLSKYLGIPKEKLVLVKGHRSEVKVFKTM